MLKTNFNPSSKMWDRKTTKALPKHDLHFGCPKLGPNSGLPIGDGDMGSLIYLEKDGLHININKCDLWQDSPGGNTYDDEIYCADHEEELTCQKHGGEIVIRFDEPLFEYIYQKEFSAHISLKDATAVIEAETPFAKITVTAFADNESHTTVLKFKVYSNEGQTPTVELQRWGSRTLWRWYSKQKFVPEVGLEGTEAYAENNMLFVTQELDPTKFCLGLAVESKNEYVSERKNSHAGKVSFEKAVCHEFTLYYNISIGTDTKDAKEKCQKVLDASLNKGLEALHQQHKDSWHDFWNKSFISIKDDYIENIYYLYLYYINSSSRGEYPPHFTCALWGFYHDYIPWVYYFHYNLQHLYAPLDATGHPELTKNYFELRKRGLSTAYLYTEKAKKKKGSFYHDVADRYGKFAMYDSLNCTPGAQIAMRMWRHWKYTGDVDFLNNYALPIMKGVTEFYMDFLEKGDDGIYHIYETTAYEGNRPTDDTLTDIVMIKALFSVYVDFADGEMKEKIKDILANLPETVTVDLALDDDWDGKVFTRGVLKGKEPFGDRKVFTVGTRDGELVRNMKKVSEYGFPDIELSPLYPAGIFGLKDKNGPLFDTMLNQAALCDDDIGFWCMDAIYFARLGLSDLAFKAMRNQLIENQVFPNGFNAESGEPPLKTAPDLYNVENVETGKRVKVPSEYFTHFDFESEPIVAMATTETLLQSHEGIIRLCPAINKEDDVAYTLYAEGGFKVNTEISENSYVVTVESLLGNGFFLKLPEYSDVRALHLYKKSVNEEEFTEMAPVFATVGLEEALSIENTEKGDIFLLSSCPIDELEFTEQTESEPNSDMKSCGPAILGSPRLLNKY